MIKKILTYILASVIFLPSFAQDASDNISGTWSGDLKVSPQASLRIVFHFEDDKVTFDSPDQGAYGIKGVIEYISGDSVRVKVPQLGAGYAGGLKNGKIEGVFKQGFAKLPLVLDKGEDKINRPQTPQPPFPYTAEEVVIKTADGKVAGTLTLPQDCDKKTPLVVMVTGSGSQNRDEEVFAHKPFAVIADFLARQGIASYRYDDRGVGGSTGDVVNATTADFARDAAEVVNYFRGLKKFGRVGILGHSEGGMIAYMLGAGKGGLDFVVSVAGPAIKGTKTIAFQNKNAVRKSGVDPAVAADFGKAVEKALEYKLAHGPVEADDELIAEMYPRRGNVPMYNQLASSLREVLADKGSNPWMDYFLAYDPAAHLQQLSCPALIIYGGRDKQVPALLNAPVARKLVPGATVKEYRELNHLMQHAQSGEVEEYGRIEETFAPEVLEDITAFILAL